MNKKNQEESFFVYSVIIFTLNIGTIPRFITGNKLDIWDNSLYLSSIVYKYVPTNY